MGADTDSQNEDQHDDSSHPTNEEQVEAEWHVWLLAILVAGGVALIIFPPGILPEAGFVLLAVAVAGWIFKTVIEDRL